MTDTAPALLWFRRDLRLADHAALTAAAAGGRPVIPVFVLDPETEAIGAAALWRLGLGLEELARSLGARGMRLVLRRGPARAALSRLAADTGARALHWTRLYDPASVARDTQVKAELRREGMETVSHPGHVLFEPWTVATGSGGPFRVFTPFWKSVRGRGQDPALPVPELRAPARWPASDRLEDWELGAAMNRGAAVVAAHVAVGEQAARDRLSAFLRGSLDGYAADRDRMDRAATSRLSENLTYGEISPRSIWHAGTRALEEGRPGAEAFLRELAWRDFAWHLMHHVPDLATANWRREWDAFPWRGDSAEAEAWRRGRTGEPVVDAAMREMFVTGTMHNRARMIVASYLTKHLLTDWRIGLAWFAECLTDWDPASNALGWQWTAGSGPDAAPYFRVYNPALQAEKFDPKGHYRHRFLAGYGPGRPHGDALSYFDAVPRSWGLVADTPPPEQPLIGLKEGRARALEAYAALRGT
ncbi:deoxyribodipyrimidine photo-lyase [Paroceanicella profunda]|uniref:Deoxyribodipyrimidine photo-lyase n=1 Tax=Paroceanicella profunda TaxID=2579971 RepID=A0A5B8FPG9_9RHOB|nr:deoxyribodipyrimidine photo-lyase [Paroceanicella profunda]QDL90356.1 deoxyribodipyrimidine photo-lyase [Paroceanicella profunda]